jgi:hypothetical protein
MAPIEHHQPLTDWQGKTGTIYGSQKTNTANGGMATMPYVLRDATGEITKVSSIAIPGGEGLAADHPDLMAFLKERGIDSTQVEGAIKELRRTDNEMSRAIEDVITALLKKNLLKMTDLPKAVQDRIALRISLRMQIQQIYDRASQEAAAAARNAANA